MTDTFRSAAYWEQRYRIGGPSPSGAGSYGRLADYKAALINGLIEDNAITHVADFGCGDGNLLSLLRLPAYTGLDVSGTTIARCAARFPEHGFLPIARVAELRPADLCLSVDVIYHLIEDDVFAAHMDALFTHASRLVLIYASNLNLSWPSPHVRHRRFSDYVTEKHPGWRLCAHAPNPYPFDAARPSDTTFADFFLYAEPHTNCVLRLPGQAL